MSAAALLALTHSRAPSLGEGRLIGIDGPAGSGKTTLAAAVLAIEPGAVVVHMDDLLAGWAGLEQALDQVGGLLGALAEGRTGLYRRWDWLHDHYTRTVAVEPVPLVVLEGVGAGSLVSAPWLTALAWVEVDATLRLKRGLERDGEAVRAHWERWMISERVHFTDHGTQARADLVV